jgi:hypothetical protein
MGLGAKWLGLDGEARGRYAIDEGDPHGTSPSRTGTQSRPRTRSRAGTQSRTGTLSRTGIQSRPGAQSRTGIHA